MNLPIDDLKTRLVLSMLLKDTPVNAVKTKCY